MGTYMKNRFARPLATLLALLGLGTSMIMVLVACDVESADTVIRTVNVNVSGVYRNTESNQNFGRFVSQNSGAEVKQLDLRQDGDQLEAIDNNNIVFKGEVSDAVENNASFYLEGKTTVGNAVLISGSIEIGSGEGTMRGTWIEDAFFSTVYGTADGPTISSNPVITTNTNIVISAWAPVSDHELATYRALVFWFSES